MSVVPDEAALPIVRGRLEAAEAEIAAALSALRAHGWPEVATDLARAQALVRTWTGPDGYLAALERHDAQADEWPGGAAP